MSLIRAAWLEKPRPARSGVRRGSDGTPVARLAVKDDVTTCTPLAGRAGYPGLAARAVAADILRIEICCGSQGFEGPELVVRDGLDVQLTDRNRSLLL